MVVLAELLPVEFKMLAISRGLPDFGVTVSLVHLYVGVVVGVTDMPTVALSFGLEMVSLTL